MVPQVLGAAAFVLAALAIGVELRDHQSGGLVLYGSAILLGAVAFVLAERSRREAQHERRMRESRARFDAKLLDSVLRMLDDERESIAHDLHDGPQQLVAAIRLMADAVDHAISEQDVERAHAALARLEEHAAAAAEELRQTTGRLHPVVLEQRGLQPALEALRSMLEDEFGIEVRLDRPAHDWPANPERDVALYGLAREAAVGAARAGASAVALALADDGDDVLLTVEAVHGGLSDLPHADIRTELLRARASSVGGSLQLARDGEGERVEVRVRHR